MASHKNIDLGEIHIPHQWEYADAAARAAATGMVPADVGKFARQLDDNSYWALTDDSPVTWQGVGGGAAGVSSFNTRTGAVTPANGDYTAAQITNTPAGGIAAVTVQNALNELDGEKANLASPTFTGTPAAPTAAGGTNTTQIATTAFVRGEIDSLIAAAPGALDTLDELAAALGDDANFASTVTTALAGKQPLDQDLTDIAALSPSNDDILQRKTGAWTNRTMAQLAADLKASLPVAIILGIGDETTAITTGTAKLTFRMPFAFTLTAVRASLTTESSSGDPTIDINEGGSTILSTKLSIDAGEKTSTTATTPAVISDSALADDAEITIDIDTAGTGAAGLKVVLIGVRA